ncbi:MAG: hypothetical protein ACFFE2_15075 [Candidatus Thorarchaeota archaeon]
MIIDKTSSNPTDLKTRLYQIVTEEKISSLSMICGMAGIDEDQTRSLLEELVDDGTLTGSFTDDGERFFLSDVKVSDAPVAPTRDKGYEIAKADTRQGKIVLIAGLATMIAGYIASGLRTFNAVMEHVGGAVVMIGLGVLIAGWLMISRADPPSNIK